MNSFQPRLSLEASLVMSSGYLSSSVAFGIGLNLVIIQS